MFRSVVRVTTPHIGDNMFGIVILLKLIARSQTHIFRIVLEILFQNAGPAPSPLGQMPPNDGLPGGPMPPGFFPVSTSLVGVDSAKIIFPVTLLAFLISGWHISLPHNTIRIYMT